MNPVLPSVPSLYLEVVDILDRSATPVRLLDRLAPRGTAPQMPGRTAGGRATLHGSELNAVIAEALPGEISTAEVPGCRDRLAMVGYVWKPPDAEAVWQPGIPSLMTYVAGHER